MNVAGYYSRYDNIQLQLVLPPPCPTCATINALRNSGNIGIWGGEAELTALLGKLQVDLSAGYSHPEYKKGSANFGQPVVNISKFNGAASSTLPIELDAGVLSLTGTCSYRSRSKQSPAVPGEKPASAIESFQKGFGRIDGRIGFKLASSPITFPIDGQNLANKHFRVATFAAGPPLGYAIFFPGAPRTVTASARFDF